MYIFIQPVVPTSRLDLLPIRTYIGTSRAGWPRADERFRGLGRAEIADALEFSTDATTGATGSTGNTPGLGDLLQ